MVKASRVGRQGWSYRRIARVLGVTDPTVLGWLERSGAKFLAPETVTGLDGKEYPATRPTAPAADGAKSVLRSQLHPLRVPGRSIAGIYRPLLAAHASC